MKVRVLNTLFCFFIAFSCFSQSKFNQFLKPSDTLNKQRRNGVIITESILATTSLIGLNALWYADFERSGFHTVNDADEWLQMDKLGHVYSSYQIGRIGADALNWAGVRKKDQLIYGATLGFVYLTAIEVLDGFSEEWGFSWSDMAANALGTGLYVGQELLWADQRMQLKYSFHTTKYADMNPDKLGDSFLEQMLKDYNGQTYWLSFNLHAFFKESGIPPWLNVAFGYGAEGMLTARSDYDTTLFPDQNRYRQYYFSLDVDLTRIKTDSNVLKTLFSVLNVLKFPFPALEINSEDGLVFHPLFY